MKKSGILQRILLMLILTGLIFLLLLSMLYVITNKQEKLMVDGSRMQFNNEVNSLVTLKTSAIQQVVYDYTYWDDFVKKINSGDSLWFAENITYLLKSYLADYVCVYDSSFNLVHEAASENFVHRGIITRDALLRVKKDRFLTYFQNTADGLVEVYCASVHPGNDPDHKRTRPSGYLFLARKWDQKFLHELSILSGAKITLLNPADSVVIGDRKYLGIVKKLPGCDGKYVARFLFARTLGSIKLYHSMSVYMILIFIGLVLTSLLIIHLTIRKWIIKPVNLVTSILKSGNPAQIKELQQCRGEFRDVGILFNDFFSQKEELRLAKEKAEKSEYKVRSMFENTLSGFIFLTTTGQILEANPAAIRILGSPSSDATKQINCLTYPPLVECGLSHEIGICLSNKQVITNEVIYTSKWGKKVYAKYFLIPIFHHEEIIGVWINLQDLTDLWQSQNDLIKAKERAEESDRLKSAFLANMSHEIRTPMNGILGFSSLLKEPGLTGEDQQEYIRIIEKSGARMLNIINDIVDISKIEAGQMKVLVSETNINDQIKYINAFFAPEAEAKGISLLCKSPLPASQAVIRTDREKLYAILTNLVKNAIKYTDKGEIEIGYKIADTKDSATLQFYVKDTGIGIPLNRQKAIFDRFVQSDIADTRAFQGAGLGLSISKAYVEMLGGKIHVVSQEGKGSVFYFTLPYLMPAKEKNEVQTILPGSDKNGQVANLKILIAEDDETSEMLISMAVRKFSREILTVNNGLDAVEACRSNPDFDLVMMDIKMPGMDGYDATRLIREFNTHVVIIAQTAFGLTGDNEKAVEAGCNDYISKPLNIASLKSLIHKHFNKQ